VWIEGKDLEAKKNEFISEVKYRTANNL
jgi:hypothetical protein